ncbi:MAG TPA: glycosyltransferase family 87 protein [Sphingomicrobium sp.]|nr:glycosyltransferase family 87 protein [Sphingomicrobium sp.]
MPKTAAGWEISEQSPWRWLRAVAIAFAIVFVLIAIWSAILNFFNPWGLDFLSFWAAGRLVLQGHASLVYNIAAHGAVENIVAPIGGQMPFPYPPPFLTIVTPFALPSFAVGFVLWVTITAAFYAYATRRVAPLALAFGNTPACIDFMIGQNGFLICGIFTLGLSLVGSSPFAAGAILGFMVFKPQLALLLPVAMLAGREWRVIAGAIASSIALLLLGGLLFGLKAYEGFWAILPHYVALLRDSKEPWNELVSPFALARFAGIPQTPALIIHALVALAATVATARAWWLKLDERVPILAAATLLIPPYAFTYDALLIVVPLGWLVTHRKHPYLVSIAWLCSFIPIITYFSPWLGPNYTSVAAVICLVALHSKSKKRSAEFKPTLATVSQ